MMKKRFELSTRKNLEMNPDVYRMRRKVMSMLYEVKSFLPDLPRITVRVTENEKNVLGTAYLKGNVMWIVKRAINLSDNQLRQVVYHEIAHAVYGAEHNESCPLMKPVVTGQVGKEELIKALKRIAKR